MTQTMATQCESPAVVEKPAEWPFVTEFYMVAGDDFVCMAYCDENGIWHNAFTHEELPSDVQFFE